MSLDEIFSKLWEIYSNNNFSVKKLSDIFEILGEVITNDHIAFRTFDNAKVNIDILSNVFLKNGYQFVQSYDFPEKKLFAKHFEHQSNHKLPRIFISQLITNEFSPFLNNTVNQIISEIDSLQLAQDNLIFSGRQWQKPSYKIYEQLRLESEYAAWLYYNGFVANHFTVSVNNLKIFNSIEKVNNLIIENGFKINTSGGAIKGSPSQLLEQSSTMADKLLGDFIEGKYEIRGCYYEFAKRYIDVKGNLYSGFIAKSADKIFESTNLK